MPAHLLLLFLPEEETVKSFTKKSQQKCQGFEETKKMQRNAEMLETAMKDEEGLGDDGEPETTGISVSETISPGMFGWWEGRQELCPSGVPRYLAYIVQFSPSGETEMDSAHSDFEAPW